MAGVALSTGMLDTGNRLVDPSRVDGATLWVLGVLFFGVGDLATTAVGLGTESATERNVVPALLVDRYGIVALLGLKLLAFGVCYVLWRVAGQPYRLGVPLGLSLLGVVATGWNLAVLFVVFGR
jgi:hypothetical protein